MALSPENLSNYTLPGITYAHPKFYIERESDIFIITSINVEPAKSKICELAQSAMEELSKIVILGKPLWQPQKGQKFEIMDKIEYLKHYCPTDEMLKGIIKMAEVGESQDLPSYDSLQVEYAPSPKASSREHVETEASRDISYVKMNPVNIVQLLMDVNEWSRSFYNIVARSTVLGVFLSGLEGSNDGKLQVVIRSGNSTTRCVLQ
ncbi:START domain [Sesbania bispinosa]|nr:START domain [Sesbania bispinosa]